MRMAIKPRVTLSPSPFGWDLGEAVDPGVLDEFSRTIKVEGSILTMSAEKDAYANTLFLVRS